MDNDARDALLAAMYDEEPAPEKRGLRTPEADVANRKTRKIAVGVIGYDVPTPEYVESLEKRLMQQERLIAEQGRVIKRLEVLFSSLRNVVSRQGRQVGDVARDLDNKIDRHF